MNKIKTKFYIMTDMIDAVIEQFRIDRFKDVENTLIELREPLFLESDGDSDVCKISYARNNPETERLELISDSNTYYYLSDINLETKVRLASMIEDWNEFDNNTSEPTKF